MMRLSESGFSFGGQHSYNNFGMMYQETNAGHPLIPQIARKEYSVAGRSGTVLFDGEEQGVLTFSGTLWPHEEPATQADAQQLIRRIQEWLTAGRQQLIFDYEPGIYYLAQLTKGASWSLKNWFGGELAITFEAQPYAYSVLESVFTGTAGQDISCAMNTLWDAPAVITVTNTDAEAALTGVSINNGQIAFSGLNIAANSSLVISCETPIGALIGTANALPYCTAFRPLALSQGANTVAVAITGAASASVEIRARGRW